MGLRKKGGVIEGAIKDAKDVVTLKHSIFSSQDIIQIIIGATILAIPVGFTEETWALGISLPILNVLGISLLSIFFISIFIHYYYEHHIIKGRRKEWFKRVLGTYFFSLAVVALLLSLIDKAPWTTDFMVALKRTILVAFPASMSAAVADAIK